MLERSLITNHYYPILSLSFSGHAATTSVENHDNLSKRKDSLAKAYLHRKEWRAKANSCNIPRGDLNMSYYIGSDPFSFAF